MKNRFFVLFFISLIFFSCTKKNVPPHTELVLGTICTVNAFEHGTQSLYKKLFERLHIIEQRMSVNIADSEISAINAAAGKNAVAVSDETFFVVERAVFFAEQSEGLFDPSVGPLVSLWSIGSDNARVPSAAEIERALLLVDYRQIELDPLKKTVFLKKAGMSLDVGGIAKGYAADVLADMLEKEGVKNALIDLGGNIYAAGSRSDGRDWRIGIKNPRAPESNPVLRAKVKNKSVVTSGMYERFFMQDGVQYHHILDTRTGYPVNNGTLSFSIISKSSLEADALSTSCFAAGGFDGIELARKFSGVEAVCITDKNTVFATDPAVVEILSDRLRFLQSAAEALKQ